jgi:hypothetical protein
MNNRVIQYNQDREIKISTNNGEPVDTGEIVLDWYYEIPIGMKKSPITLFTVLLGEARIITFNAFPYVIYATFLTLEATHYTIYRTTENENFLEFFDPEYEVYMDEEGNVIMTTTPTPIEIQ